MAHLNYFGIENFRIFRENTGFELRPITVLVGTNSSGKSSLIKGLTLLKEMFGKSSNFFSHSDDWVEDLFIYFLDTFGNYGLGNFKSTSNFEGVMAFEFPFQFSVLPQKTFLRLEYIQDESDLQYGKLHRLLVLWEEGHEPILDINFSTGQYLSDYSRLFNNFNNNLSQYLKVISQIEEYNNNKNNPDLDDFVNNQEILVNEIKSLFPTFNSGISIFSRFDNHDFDSFKSFKMYIRIYDKIKRFKTGLPLLEYSFFKTDKELVSEIGEELLYTIREKENEFIRNHKIKKSDLTEFLLKLEFNHIQKLGNKFDSKGYFNNKSLEYGTLPNKYISSYFDLFFKEHMDDSLLFLFKNRIINYEAHKIGTKKESNLEVFSSYINTEIKNNFGIIKNIYNSLYFIPTDRSKNERNFNIIKDSDYFTKKLKEFKGKVLNEEARNFFKTYLKKFGIGDEIEFETSDDSTFVRVYLIIDKKRILLNDIGYGVSAILPILLTIGITLVDNDSDVFQQFARYSSIIVIEEPETNLHPALQSKLADLFIECYEKYDIQFIIETHSEYLIRKLQYLVAKKDFKAEDAVIYNFRKATDDNPEIVKRIDINEDGSLSKNFYPGFFDESDNLAISLFNLNNKN
jgi:predicted ATPase